MNFWTDWRNCPGRRIERVIKYLVCVQRAECEITRPFLDRPMAELKQSTTQPDHGVSRDGGCDVNHDDVVSMETAV
jgi:hypothetical protein